MSVRVTLNCPLNPSLVSELKPFLEANLPNVRGFEGNRKVEVLFDENQQEMLLDEEWASPAHHQAYMKFIENNGVLGQLSEYLAGPPVVKYFVLEQI